MTGSRRAGCLASLWLAASAAGAQEPRSLALSAGAFDVNKTGTSSELGVEYRLPVGVWKLAANFGLYGTSDSSLWVFAGMRRDVSLGGGWRLTPGLGIAFYEEGDGKDLGGPVEFRSAIELGYEWPSRRRLAVAAYHLSNAGIYDLNPGSNSVVLTLSLPLD